MFIEIHSKNDEIQSRFAKFEETEKICTKRSTKFCMRSELNYGAVRRNANLVELENAVKSAYSRYCSCVQTDENEASRVQVKNNKITLTRYLRPRQLLF